MDRKPYHFPIDSDHCFRLFAEFHVARSDCIHHFFELMPLVDFLIPPPLTVTLSQAQGLYGRRDKDRKESNSNKVKELSYNAH